ncbi:MAG TPA: short-chain dehydrogenase [Idiomarina sp.]|nr:short-chain dehydrogenase [Idiomarina sp.]
MAMVVFGAAGGLGRAITERLVHEFPEQQIIAISRQSAKSRVTGVQYIALGEYGEQSLSQWASNFKQAGAQLDGVVSTIGMLHDEETFPEKQLADITADNLEKLFAVNAVAPMLILKHCQPLFDKKNKAFFVQLSAKVGSIEDNYLGGWYAYRASKAALNMQLKTASIELKRSHKKLVVAAIHPGTTDTRLSKPFQKRVPEGKLYSASLSAERIVNVIKGLTPDKSGGLFHWDGVKLPY